MQVAKRTVSRKGARVGRGRPTPEVEGFTTTFTVGKSPQEVFDAINDVRGWWTGEIDGSTDRLGAEFTYRYKEFHRSTQRITELVPGKRVVWHVVDANLAFVEDRTEWDGTDVVFDIARKGNQTEVRFTHVGLVPRLRCYEDCASAWGFFVSDRLRNLIEAGRGDSLAPR